MTPEDVRKEFLNCYIFSKRTGMSASSFLNWIRMGRVPLESQKFLERITKGKLKCGWVDMDSKGGVS